MDIVPGYEPLAEVFQIAHDQAARGKGLIRHANAKPFLQQPIFSIGRMVGIGYNVGQAMKKGQEAMRLPDDRAQAELLGAMVYLASAYLLIGERMQGETARAAFTPVQDPCAKCDTGECNEHKEIAAKLAGTCEDRVQDDNACPVCGEQMIGKPRGCGKHGFTSIPAPVQEKIDLSLPSITVTGTEDECRQKHHEELTEMKNELAGSTKFFIEAWDVLQAARTWQERCDPVFAGGASMAVHQAEKLLASFTDYNKIRHAKTLALIKNAERFYYAPEVCKVILDTNGQRWQ